MVQADLVSSSNEDGPKICIKDSCGHGTHVAGTVMATAGNSLGIIGVVPGVRLHVVKVFGDDNLVDGVNCAWTYSSRLIDALNSCQTNGSNITSMSLGGGARSRTEQKAFDNAYADGMLHVAAAGNDGNKRTSFPAGYASVISVAAVDSNEVVADFSQKNRDVELASDCDQPDDPRHAERHCEGHGRRDATPPTVSASSRPRPQWTSSADHPSAPR